jgi:phosphoribosylglycinamide formyltransferase-1
MSPKRKVGVLISGRGTNLLALIGAVQDPDFPAQIAMVISNEPRAYGLTHAVEAGIPWKVIDHRDFADRAAFDAALTATLEAAQVDLVAHAGFMRIVTDDFVAHWRDRMINIHPSLLPMFKGLDTHARALAAGVKLHGCSVHYVRAEIDSGPIIGQAAVPVLSADTAGQGSGGRAPPLPAMPQAGRRRPRPGRGRCRRDRRRGSGSAAPL